MSFSLLNLFFVGLAVCILAVADPKPAPNASTAGCAAGNELNETCRPAPVTPPGMITPPASASQKEVPAAPKTAKKKKAHTKEPASLSEKK